MKSKKRYYTLEGYDLEFNQDTYAILYGTEYKVKKYLKDFRKWYHKEYPTKAITWHIFVKDFVEV